MSLSSFLDIIKGPYWVAILIVALTIIFYRPLANYILSQLKVILMTENLSATAHMSRVLTKPLRAFFFFVGLYIACEISPLAQNTKEGGSKLIESFILFIVFWVLYRSIPYAVKSLHSLKDAFGPQLTDGMITFFAKFIRLLILFLAVMSILQKWDINVVSFLTALGLGGMAVSLAARGLLENYFGTLSIFMDRTFSQGDHIKVNQVEGIVEFIGMRSTRLRLLEGGVVIMPNSEVVKNPVTNYTTQYMPEDEFHVTQRDNQEPT